MDDTRPRLELPYGVADKLLLAGGLGGVAVLVALLVEMPDIVPARAPVHVGFSGRPDRWGSASELMLVPVIGIVLYAGLFLVSRIPHHYNYPFPITKENAPAQYTLARRLIFALQAILVWLFAGLMWGTIQVATGARTLLDPLVYSGPLVAFAVTLVWYFVAAFRTR